jgi:23S rRNA pseudouridine2605 synthase
MRKDRSEKSLDRNTRNPKSREERKSVAGKKQEPDKKPDDKFKNSKGTDRKPDGKIRAKKESERKPEGKTWDKKETGKKPFSKSSPIKKAYKSTSISDRPIVKKGFRPDEKIRLNRFLANSGVCSRREADVFIQSGCVTVNGKIVSELGSKVSLSDDVRFSGQQLTPERKVYLLLNKPKGFVTTTDDPQERKTVMNLIENACPERVYPVGRLDKDTTWLLLFTNDGDLVKKLTHPSHSRKKIYHVYLDKPLTKNNLLEIAKGVQLEDGFVGADAINYVDEEDKREIGIEIHSGQNRVVRRIFAHLGYEVQKLDRVYFAGLTKKNLPRGKWRFLTQIEINQLKMQS